MNTNANIDIHTNTITNINIIANMNIIVLNAKANIDIHTHACTNIFRRQLVGNEETRDEKQEQKGRT